MLFYVMLILTAIRRMRSISTDAPEAQKHHARFYYLAAGIQASLIGYMVCSFFISVAFQHYLYYLLGYAFCLHRIYESQKPEKAANSLAADERRSKHDERGRRPWRAPSHEPEAAPGSSGF